MTGGAFGSLFAQFFHLSSAERKTLLVAGAAGGMAAIFATPIAAVLLAVELMLFEWKPRSLIPVAVAATVAGVLRVYLFGAGPVFAAPAHLPPDAVILILAFGVGILAGGGASILTSMVYLCEDAFQRLRLHWMWWPSLGGLFVGLGGLFEPRVLGVGYDLIDSLLRGEIIGMAALGLLVGKALVWSIALGSGTSGGVLAPLLMIGAALGVVVSGFLPEGNASLWALIGMAAMMSGTMRVPLTALVFAVEATHDFNLLPALLIGNIGAYLVTVLLLKRSILTEKIARRGLHISREYSVDSYDLVRVGDVMDKNVPTIPAALTVGELSSRIAQNDSALARRQGTPIVDAEGKLVGIITRSDLIQALAQDPRGEQSVLDAGSRDLVVTYPDETLHEAIKKMLQQDIGRLPVVAREDPHKLLGYIGRAGVLAARSRAVQDEAVRERLLNPRGALPRT